MQNKNFQILVIGTFLLLSAVYFRRIGYCTETIVATDGWQQRWKPQTHNIIWPQNVCDKYVLGYLKNKIYKCRL